MSSLPLANLNIVVTRPREQAAGLIQNIERLGGNALPFPLLEIEPVPDARALREQLARLRQTDLVIFISPNAVRYGMAAIGEALSPSPTPASGSGGCDSAGEGAVLAQFKNLQVATVGQGSAKALRELGVAQVIAPQERFDSEGLLALPELQDMAGKRVMILRGDGGRELLGDTLKARGATVEYVSCYLRRKHQLDAAALAAAKPDVISVTSSEALAHLWETLEGRQPAGAALFVPHPRIAELARQQGWKDIVVTESGDDGLIASLVAWTDTGRNRLNMNDQTQQPSTTETPAAAPQAPARGNALANLLGRVTLTQLTLAVLVAVFVWQWLDSHRQLNLTQQEVARRLSEVEAANKGNQMLVAQNQELVRELGGKLSLLESRFAETQNQRAALESLYQDMSSSRDQTALAEVEQMLLIAGQQLQLSANVKAALIAMQQADSRLQHLDRPAFAGLRTRIGQDIDKLRALPNIDAPVINQKLDGVVAAVDALPLAQDGRIEANEAAPAADPDEGILTRFWRELRQETRHLVRIENTGQREPPLVSPTQAFFLRENLKLRLLSARMALVTRDEVSFRRDLKTAQEWLKRYFDVKSEAGAQALATLQKLGASSIVIDMPDISGSLEAVRNYRASHERGAR